jgi:hypothetical protein
VQAAGIHPFRVDLAGFGTFAHGKQVAVWLRPDDGRTGAIEACLRAGMAAVPFCDEALSRGAFTPHLRWAHAARACAAAARRGAALGRGALRGGGGGLTRDLWAVRVT